MAQWTSGDDIKNVFGMPSAIVVPHMVQVFIRSRLERLVVTATFYSYLSLPVSCFHARVRLRCSPGVRRCHTFRIPLPPLRPS